MSMDLRFDTVQLPNGKWRVRKDGHRFYVGTAIQRPDIAAGEEFLYEPEGKPAEAWRILSIDPDELSFYAEEIS